ncbi:MAG: DUF1566 domain-containing protein [Nitrospinae bacterium]|nr:DUF1566 domain-containing protein [Nitrospinota bacterium]
MAPFRYWISIFLAVALFALPMAYGAESLSADGRFRDLGDGAVIDGKSGLAWAREDSWSQLGKCLTWLDAQDYVKNLQTGGFSDWRLPTMEELSEFPKGLVERNKPNNVGADYKDWKEKYPLLLDPIFGPVGAYWLWSSETDGPERAGFVDMRTGTRVGADKKTCFVMGVRAVRAP